MNTYFDATADSICPTCNGSGEGRSDGSRCFACNGEGCFEVDTDKPVSVDLGEVNEADFIDDSLPF